MTSPWSPALSFPIDPGELDLETPMSPSAPPQRSWSAGALRGSQQLGPGWGLSPAPGPKRSGPGPPAPAVVALWLGQRVRAPRGSGRRRSCGPARGDPALGDQVSLPGAGPARALPGANPRPDTHLPAAAGHGPGRAGRLRSAAAAAAPRPARDSPGPRPPWQERRRAAWRGQARRRLQEACEGALPARSATPGPAPPGPRAPASFSHGPPRPGRAARGQGRPSLPPSSLLPPAGLGRRGRGQGGPRAAVSPEAGGGAGLECPAQALAPNLPPGVPAQRQRAGSLGPRLFVVSYDLTRSLLGGPAGLPA